MLPLLEYLAVYLCFVCNVYGSIMKKSSPQSADDGSDLIHCYCNLPHCITTSYMCKSESGESGCFKKFEPVTDNFFYGCLGSSVAKKRCSSSNQTTNSFPVESLYECCFSDMCNNDLTYQNTVHSTHIRIHEADEQKMKEILLGNYGKSTPYNYYTNSEIWLRAGLIAVPFCGLIVLMILISVAVKMLRSDLPQNGRFTSTHLRKKFNASDMNNVKILPGAENCYRSQLLPTSDKFENKLSIVFKPQQEKNWKNVRYSNCPQEENSFCDNFEPTVHKKFSKQNLNILKLPYKFNELKSKNNCIYKSANANHKSCDGGRHLNDSSIVTIDSNVNYHNYSLINNFIR